MRTSADVGELVLGIVAGEAADPSGVLEALVRAAGGFTGLTAGAALHSEGAVRGVVTSGPRGSREVLSAGFGQGPGGECARSGRPVVSVDLAGERARWLAFVAKATTADLGSAWAFPVGHGTAGAGTAGHGALLILGRSSSAPDLDAARVLAEAAAVGIDRVLERVRVARENAQLREALQSRIVVEQAKGALSAHAGIDVTTAFEHLRTHARRRGRPLTEVASAVVERRVDPSHVLGT
ncbi:GAF and ANTAR domain-containing protein [Pseudonocardia sp. ICBG162]|uniref:GAF and ANTAR domain-containing protein n=1 Tax=Pseudonocardia sp. ICBG162 TaxID=2846761 RepID=UPI001CF6C86D|nr:GAF and ANTAR domain-containing protein [Pseudonocardia sp. ICBG162]